MLSFKMPDPTILRTKKFGIRPYGFPEWLVTLRTQGIPSNLLNRLARKTWVLKIDDVHRAALDTREELDGEHIRYGIEHFDVPSPG